MRLLTGILRILAAAFIVAGLMAAPAMAETAPQPAPQVKIDKRKLLVQPRNADGSIATVAFWEDPVLWVRDRQQAFYGAMSGAIRNIRSGAPLAAAGTLMLLSFGYGVFHAAGPGHGKAVISAWLLATESELRRGLLIALLSAVIQALSAILIVSALLLLVTGVGSAARDVAGVLESASYGLIGLMGLYLVWTAVAPLLRRAAAPVPAMASAPLHRFEIVSPPPNANHRHRHTEADCACGHVHVPEARQVNGDWSLAKAFSLAFAVGIRPCTGAILVLVFANAMGLYWAGVASTFAMAVGTFITVSAIAAIAVYSRKLALRLAARDDRWLDRLGLALRLGGGTAIAGLGALLFLGSLGNNSGMM